LLHNFNALLNPAQVIDLTNQTPEAAVNAFVKLPDLKVLVCGGDGTAGKEKERKKERKKEREREDRERENNSHNFFFSFSKGWVLKTLEKYCRKEGDPRSAHLPPLPPVAMLPLGTGNGMCVCVRVRACACACVCVCVCVCV
jgi:diacylglycerol kinase (ATP)